MNMLWGAYLRCGLNMQNSNFFAFNYIEMKSGSADVGMMRTIAIVSL